MSDLFYNIINVILMGKLFEQFKEILFSNEAEVSQKFIIPLLTEYLGYSINEIIPEKRFPAKEIFSGVNFAEGGSKGLTHRPDFIICIEGDLTKCRFIIDSKGPSENLGNHIGQLKSYATSVGQNFLMITNGKDLLVYDVNNLIFSSDGLEDLQLKLDVLKDLLGRKNQLSKSTIDILKEFNLDKALSLSTKDLFSKEKQKKELQISDFKTYLSRVRNKFANWHLPNGNFKALNNIQIQKIDPNYLLQFKHHSINETFGREEKIFKFGQIESIYNVSKKVFVGDTGTGKTSLLKFITFRTAENALDLIDVKIPVYIALKEIGHGYTLENLISATLRRNGYPGNDFEELNSLTQFIFYLDAFDEVADPFRIEVCNAIENLSIHYECYITTRPNNVPRLNNVEIFDICPLTDLQVEKLVRQYLGSNFYQFQHQVENNDLVSESRNVLLLLFMISLYTEKGYLPGTVSKVISALIERVKLWQDSRNINSGRLEWEQMSAILAALAYWIFENNVASVKVEEAEPIILNLINEFEQKRKIKPGVTIREVIEELTSTGLIISGEDHLFFWHRLFLNHFSALELQKRCSLDTKQIEELSLDERWDIAIISLASRVDDVTDLVVSLQNRLWLAAYCLTENPNCNSAIVEKIVNKLIEYIDAPVPDVRSKVVSFLEKINNDQTRSFLLSTFQKTSRKDVKMMCLSSIANNPNDRVKEIIYSYIDWDEWFFFHGKSSQAYIVQALSHFGDQGYEQIITNWEKFSNYPMDETCKKIFQRLYSYTKLNQNHIVRLQNLFLKEFAQKDAYSSKVDAIADILELVPSLEFAEEVLDLFLSLDDKYPKSRSVYKILKNSPYIELAKKIHESIVTGNVDNYKIENLAKALRKSVVIIPKEMFYELINHSNINVACQGLYALSRFAYQEVESEIKKHLYGEQPQLQCWALKLLVDNGKIINIIRENRFPNPFFIPTAHTLLEAVRRFHLVEAMPLLHIIQDELSKDEMYLFESTLAYDLAGTFNYMGDIVRQRAVIALYFDGTSFLHNNERYQQTNLMKKLKYFDQDSAFQIAKAFYNLHLPSFEDFSSESEIFIETAEDLGGEWMRKKMKELTEHYLNLIKNGNKFAMHSIERPLRAMTKIGRPDDEDWLLEKLPYLEFDAGAEYTQLRRAIECLAFIGSKKVLPFLLEMSEKYQQVDSVMNILQFSYNNICSREKIPIEDSQRFPAKN